MDLFSNQLEQIQSSITELFNCPQNNLKVYHGQTLLFGERRRPTATIDKHTSGSSYYHHDSSSSSISSLQQIVHDFFPNNYNQKTNNNTKDNIKDNDAESILQENIQKLISKILHSHSKSLLSSILLLQTKLDVLDYDGVTIIYQRLIDLCNGSKEEAEQLIDSNHLFVNKDCASANECLLFHHGDNDDDNNNNNKSKRDLQLYLGSGSKKVKYYLDICDKCKVLILGLKTKTCPASTYMEQFRKEIRIMHECAIDIVQTFDKNDCIGLLQNWLLSLMMCDVSFIVTIHPMSRDDLEKIDSMAMTTTTAMKKKNLKCICLDGKNNRSSHYYYDIKIIDLDGKPAKKLRNRSVIEAKMAQFYEKSIMY